MIDMELEHRIATLEARIAKLESGASATASGPEEALEDHHLDKDWARKTIKKDPPRWAGESQIGRTYADAPVAWLLDAAGLAEWKAKKGREESPVRMKDNGKPWHESDTFEAKLLRAWAKRNAGKTSGGAAISYADEADEIPF